MLHAAEIIWKPVKTFTFTALEWLMHWCSLYIHRIHFWYQPLPCACLEKYYSERELMTGKSEPSPLLRDPSHTQSVILKICKNTFLPQLCEQCYPEQQLNSPFDFKHLLQALKDRLITWLQVMTESSATSKLKLLHKSSASLQCCVAVLQHCMTSPGLL